MILLSLASKQVWPQILAVHHLQPSHLVLMHSEDANESQQPAQRLKKFFDKNGPIPQGNARLEALSDSDFAAIERRLDELSAARAWNLGECVLNITGGNKLMATAAFRWAARRSVRTFYLERRNQITWFDFQDGATLTSAGKVEGTVANDLDPVALLRCQVDASEVEREGERLTLNPVGAAMADSDFFNRLQNGGDPGRYLEIQGVGDKDQKQGDALELTTAAVLLKLGVKRVQRSLRLKVKSAVGIGTRSPHAEIDLLFSWNGKLWLVDCKDRKSTDSLVDGLRRELGPQRPSPQAEELLQRIGKQLSIGESKVLKEDLLAVRETGGLLGQVVCVRKSEMSDEVQQFAKHNRIEIIRKHNLVEQWRSLLFPNRAPDAAQLNDLARAFGR